MEPQESTQGNWVYSYDSTLDDATENGMPPLKMCLHTKVRLQPSMICMRQLQPWCSAALVPKFTTLRSGMKVQIRIETTLEQSLMI